MTSEIYVTLEQGTNGVSGVGVDFAEEAFGARPRNNMALAEATWPLMEQGGCCCDGCMGKTDIDFFPTGDLAPIEPNTGALEATLMTMATWLEMGYRNAGKFNLGTSDIFALDGRIDYMVDGFTGKFRGTSKNEDPDGLTPLGQDLVRTIMQHIEANLGIDMVEIRGDVYDDVEIMLTNDDPGNTGGSSRVLGDNTSILGKGSANVSSNVRTDSPADQSASTFWHEIFHVMGLGHQGPYNSVPQSELRIFELDSDQASVMSYFSQDQMGDSAVDRASPATPMIVDWLALETMYGAYDGFGVENAFRGNTVYGFNTNVSAAESPVLNQLANFIDDRAATIVDADGNDTLDFSGFSEDQKIDLTIQHANQTNIFASDIGGKKGNVVLSVGTVIENAQGGSGNDSLIGNRVDNVLTGNGGDDRMTGLEGDDTLVGGAGTDTAVYISSVDQYAISYDAQGFAIVGEGRDSVRADVERFQFFDRSFSAADLRAYVDARAGQADAVRDAARLSANDGVDGADGTVLSNDGVGSGMLRVDAVNGATGGVGQFVDASDGGRIRINADGSYDFDADEDFEALGAGVTAQTSISYSVRDSSGQRDTATLAVTVVGENEAVQAVDDAVRVSSTGRLSPLATKFNVLANDLDKDNDQLWVTAYGDGRPLGFANFVTASNGESVLVQITTTGFVSFNTAGKFDDLEEGETVTLELDYQVSDRFGGTDVATTTISIVGGDLGNEPPVALDDTITVTKGARVFEPWYNFNLLANDYDPEGNTVEVTAAGSTTVGRAFSKPSSEFTGNVWITVDPDGYTTVSLGNDFAELGAGESEFVTFDYTISDGERVSTATATINIEGYDGTTPPSLTAQDVTLTVGESIDLSEIMSVTKTAGEDIWIFLLDGTGETNFRGGYTENQSYVASIDTQGVQIVADDTPGTQVLSAYASNNFGTSERIYFDLTTVAEDVNTPPEAENDAVLIKEDGSIGSAGTAFNLLTNDRDIDNDPLTISTVNGGTAAGSTFSVRASDGTSVSVKVDADGSVTMNPGTRFAGLADGETATISFDYTVTDGAATDTAQATITIEGEGPANTKPVVSANNVTLKVGETVDISEFASFSDPEGDALTAYVLYDSVGSSNWRQDGTPLSVFNTVSDLAGITLAADETPGGQTLWLRTSDGALNSNWTSFRLTTEAAPVNTAPVANPDRVTILEDGRVGNDATGLNIIANDTDAEGDTIQLVNAGGQPPGSSFTVAASNGTEVTVTVDADGNATMDPGALFSSLETGETATVSFPYVITDGTQTASSIATIEVEGVSQPNRPPVVTLQNVTLEVGESIDLAEFATTSDPDGDTLESFVFFDGTGDVNWENNGQAMSRYATLDTAEGVKLVADDTPSTQTVWMSVSDGELFSAWANLTLTTEASPETNTKPVVSFSDLSGRADQWIYLPSVFEFNDAEGDSLQSLQIWDGTPGYANWWSDGGFLDPQKTYTRDDANSTWFRYRGDAESDPNLYVRANDGTEWSDWARIPIDIA